MAKRFGFHQSVGQSLRRVFALFAVSLLAALGGLALLSPPAIATVLYTADTSGSVIVQSRRTLRDQYHYSWQAIAFKPISPDGSGALSLRLVGFPGVARHCTSTGDRPDQPPRAKNFMLQIPLIKSLLKIL